MRKETIIKYEKEFLAWCKGESVLLGAPASMHDKALIWREVKDFNDWKPLDTVYVLNDSYSYYRKALAEGKTIQYYVDGFAGWQDVKSIEQSCKHPDYFRIKPDVPKFKVGDWVIHNGVVKQVTMTVNGLINSLDKQLAVIKKEESLELWKPKSNEYFWYKNYLVKFDDIKTNYGTLLESIRGCSYHTAEQNFEDFCEPFIGKLPSYLKELNKNE